MFLLVGLDATIEQTVVPDPVHLDVVLVEQPQLPPDALSVCAVFGVRVFAEEKNTKDHQRTLEVLDEENISLRPTRA